MCSNGTEFTLQSCLNYKDYRDRNTVFSGLLAYRFVVASLQSQWNKRARLGLRCFRQLLRFAGSKTRSGSQFSRRGRSDPGFTSSRDPESRLLAKTIRRRPCNRGQKILCSTLHPFTVVGVAPKGFGWNGGRLRAGILGSDDDEQTNRAREHLAGRPGKRQSFCRPDASSPEPPLPKRKRSWMSSPSRWRKSIQRRTRAGARTARCRRV